MFGSGSLRIALVLMVALVTVALAIGCDSRRGDVTGCIAECQAWFESGQARCPDAGPQQGRCVTRAQSLRTRCQQRCVSAPESRPAHRIFQGFPASSSSAAAGSL